MSCCTIEKEMKGSVKEIELLKKHFDEVLLEQKENYQLLTLRDKSPKTNYDWIVYLQVKIPHKEHNSHSGTSDEKYVEGVVKPILDYIDLLKEECGAGKPKTLSLFGDEEKEEPLLKTPQEDNDISWDKYYKEEKRIKKNHLMKKYNFFELCNFESSWYVYRDNLIVDSWIAQLPKNNKEMIELVKDAIVKGDTTKDGYGRFDDFWWDNEYNYIVRNDSMSDYEIFHRAVSLVRLYLVPYKEYMHVNVDMSYSAWEIEEQTDYRFWFDGCKINGQSWLKCDIKYDLNDEDFISWLREYFNIAKKEVISDEEILKLNIKSTFQSAFGYEDPDFDIYKELNDAKDLKEFKSIALKNKSKSACGKSGCALDGFQANINLHGSVKKTCIEITQSKKRREELGRSIEGLKDYDSTYHKKHVIVYDLNFMEVLEKAYDFFKKDTKPKQTSLFDFLAA